MSSNSIVERLRAIRTHIDSLDGLIDRLYDITYVSGVKLGRLIFEESKKDLKKYIADGNIWYFFEKIKSVEKYGIKGYNLRHTLIKKLFDDIDICRSKIQEKIDKLSKHMNKKIIDEVFEYNKDFEQAKSSVASYGVFSHGLFGNVNDYLFRNKVTKEIASIKDHIQNTSDIVNLFTDIDKNRDNTDEEIKKVYRKIEKQNKEIKKVNSRLDNLETSISQILALLQKN